MEERLQAGLARFIASCDMKLVAQKFKDDAKLRILDWIGCALSGEHYPQVELAAAYLDEEGSDGCCTVFGREKRYSTRVAAFLNGIAGHVCELDDGHRTAIGHPGSVTVPVALALAEKYGSSGEEVLRSVILGYDMFTRTGRTVNPAHYKTWHTTGTCGTFAAAATAAALLKLTPEQADNAIGIAATCAGGLVESFGYHSKAINIAEACQNGIDAARLAARGFTGARTAIVGKKGFIAATCSDPHPENLENPSEETLVSDTAFFKVYSSCGHTNSPLDVVFGMRKAHGIKAEDIEAIEVRTYRISVDLTSALKVATEDEAKFSLPYCIALALAFGSVSLNYFSEETRTNPEVLALARRIRVVESPEATSRFPHRQAEVTITLRDGSVLEDKTMESKDAAEPEQIYAKFRAAAPMLSEEKQDAVIDFVMHIDEKPDISGLISLLR